MPVTWNEQTAAHLYRRAGFGSTAAELADAVRDGLQVTVDRLVNYETVSNDALDHRLAAMKLVTVWPNPFRLTDAHRWIMTRMIYTARPLEERMVFFLHNHFATNWMKFMESDWLVYQNETLRTYATGNFQRLLVAIAQDVAMQLWLDNADSVKDHPNENFGRELLELFTLGRGNYAESDVITAARAFTGWNLTAPFGIYYYQYRDEQHDHGMKTFMGQTADWDGTDVIRIICAQFSHARFLAAKLFAWFAYDDPEPALVDRLARVYYDNGTELKPLITAILTSDEMYSPRAMWTKVKSPIEHVVMTYRMLELESEVPNTVTNLRSQGQVPFEPPSVEGWPSGTDWMTSVALLNRMNFANAAVAQFDPLTFGIPSTGEELVDLYLQRLGPLTLAPEVHRHLVDYVAPGGTLPRGTALLTRARGLAHMILSLPEWQMV